MAVITVDNPLPAYDHEAITVSTSALGLTSTKITVVASIGGAVESQYQNVKHADEALITTETDKVRFRLDGTNPTSSTGHELAAGDTLIVSGWKNIQAIRFIRSGSADATLRCTYYSRG
jgi:hypothetical protein